MKTTIHSHIENIFFFLEENNYFKRVILILYSKKERDCHKERSFLY